ncbi:EamA family transporter, partial [Patescibacteria group bacterium]|nr:EamA family transporter [Patescibacteria group bacterium]
KAFFWSQLAGIIFTVLLIPFFGISTHISFLLGIIIALSSMIYAAGYLFFYKAFEVGNVSIVSAISNLNVIIAMLIAVIFSGQSLIPFQLFSVFLVLSGAFFVSVNFSDFKKNEFKLLAGVKEVLIASVFFGIFWNLSEYISEKIGWLPTSLYVKFGAIISLLIFSSFAKKKLKIEKANKKILLVVVLVGVLEAAAVVSMNYGLEFGDLVLVSPIASALSIVTILMAVVFLKEKISKIQTLGIIITIIGIILASL